MATSYDREINYYSQALVVYGHTFLCVKNQVQIPPVQYFFYMDCLKPCRRVT